MNCFRCDVASDLVVQTRAESHVNLFQAQCLLFHFDTTYPIVAQHACSKDDCEVLGDGHTAFVQCDTQSCMYWRTT